MVNDISCYLSKYQDKKFVSKNLNNIGTLELWASEYACDFLNSAEITKLKTFEELENIPNAWFEILRKDPGFIIKTHLNRHSYLLPIPVNGLPDVPFIHSNIEQNNLDISHKFTAISDVFRNFLRAYNYFNEIFAWSGLWLLIIALILINQPQRQYFVVCLSVSLSLILFIFAPIPDARYALFTILVGQIMSIGFVVQNLLAKNLKN
jgi:hypothetical protein